MTLDPRLATRLKQTRATLEQRGQLLPAERMDVFLANFRARFGPDRLRTLSGTELLDTMHRHGGGESLVYWLEFKNDEEFEYRPFGSIAGGSALKFRLYWRAENGSWMTGNSTEQRAINEAEAVAMAESHRGQLIAGVEAIQAMPAEATLEDYRRLQEKIERVAPDIGSLGWAHKYFFLLAPDRLDDYHLFNWQRFMLLKLLQQPPDDQRRYEAAYYFRTFAQELDWRIPHLTAVMNECFGSPRRYWRVGTTEGHGGSSQWQRMHDAGCMAVGYGNVGDLSDVASGSQGLDVVRQRLAALYSHAPTLSNQSKQLFNFVGGAKTGDVVVAGEGNTVLGVGQISGEYTYEPDAVFKHVRPVAWGSFESFSLPDPDEVKQTTFKEIKRDANILAIERHLLDASERRSLQIPPPPAKGPSPVPGPYPVPTLPAVEGRIQAALDRKGQVIVYGPPGTGKTYQAEQTVRDLAALQNFNRHYRDLEVEEQKEIIGDDHRRGYVRLVSFHPGYGYEDFIEGYRPSADGSQLRFALRDGVFKQLCADAAAKSNRRFYLVIDEINRADVPRVLGELMTVLELDKRSKPVLLPLSGVRLRIPDNIRVVGTMNTADRSIALLDAALRRRFAFIELMPDYDVLVRPDGEVNASALLRRLNQRIRAHLKRDARGLQIGHAYLLEAGVPITDTRRLAKVLQDDVIPLVQEYCYDDPEALRGVLGELVDKDGERIRDEQFERDALLSALRLFGDDVVRAVAVEEPGPADDEAST